MTAESPAPARRRRKPLVLALVALAVVGAVVLGVLLLTGGNGDSEANVENRARLSYPDTWRELGGDRLRRAGDRAVAALQRQDQGGLIVVRVEPPRRQNYGELGRDLQRALRRRFPDYRAGSRRLVRTRAGKAYYFSWVRTRAGTAQSITIAKVGDRTYSLNTVIRGGARKAAAEAGAIIRSFGPAS